MCHITKTPSIMDKIQDELKDTGCMNPDLGNAPESPYPISKFEYLDAVMKETVRKYRYSINHTMSFIAISCNSEKYLLTVVGNVNQARSVNHSL